MSWRGTYDSETTYSANDAVISSEGRGFYARQETTGNEPPLYPDREDSYWSLFAERGESGAEGQKLYWDDMPGSPERITDSTFKIFDQNNDNLYDKRFVAGVIISWLSSGGSWRVAKVISATYAAHYVTFTIIGNALVVGFTDMKFCVHRALEDVWIIPGNMPTSALANIGKSVIWREDRYVFSAVVAYQTAPTTTGGVWDINSTPPGGSLASIFTTKLAIATGTGYKEGTETVCDSLLATATTAVVAKSQITLDYDSGHATTPGADAYIFIWSFPVAWRYIP